MLRVKLHYGALADRNEGNLCAVLDIAYAKQSLMSDYLVSLTVRNGGHTEPAMVTSYPRWSGSLWDLVARALGASLYGSRPIPPADKPDRRCAYATRLCAAIEGADAQRSGLLLGTASIEQVTDQRGRYAITLDEDIMGARSGRFEFGTKRLNPAELLFRGICQALYKTDIPVPRPSLIVPALLKVNGEAHFDVQALSEPARTGFTRYLARRYPTAEELSLARAEDYAQFLAQS